MNVKEFINCLQKYPDDMQVKIIGSKNDTDTTSGALFKVVYNLQDSHSLEEVYNISVDDIVIFTDVKKINKSEKTLVIYDYNGVFPI